MKRTQQTSPAGQINILEAMTVFWSAWFRDPATWAAWRVFLAVLFGLPLSAADLVVYRERTGRMATPPPDGFTEAWLCCGRRAGKSFILALIAYVLVVGPFALLRMRGKWAKT